MMYLYIHMRVNFTLYLRMRVFLVGFEGFTLGSRGTDIRMQ